MATPVHTLPDWHSIPPASPVLREWLLNEGSLTRLLKQLSNADFHVQLVQQGWQQLRSDECRALGTPVNTEGWVREVFLCGHQQPWVYARSVAGKDSLQAHGFDLTSLGTRSLGELLFSDRAFARGEFEMCRLPASAWPSALLTSGNSTNQSLWARRSCFARDSLKILVAEAFLPAFWDRIKQNSPI